jgi:hypothetical protein
VTKAALRLISKTMRDFAFQGINPCAARHRTRLAINAPEATGSVGQLASRKHNVAAARIRMSEIAGMSGLAGAIPAAVAIM